MREKMKECAYCKNSKKLTREHIIPDWFLKIDPSDDDSMFFERIPKKFLYTDAVIKDVCSECNNSHLSNLDSYGKALYDTFFNEHIYKNETIDFKYDYDLLVKWLIKLSYNSARANKTDLEVLEDYGNLIINDNAMSEEVIVYCASMAASNIDDFPPSKLAERNEKCDIYLPNWFRIGFFRVPEFDSHDLCFRHVTINSYSFFIFIPKLKDGNYLKQKKQLIAAIKKEKRFGELLTKGGHTILSPPLLDAYSSYMAHIVNNPIAYDIPYDNITHDVINDDFGLIMYKIPRSHIESGDTTETKFFLDSIISCREVALAYLQKIEFTVDGYNEDSRELFEIAEVVDYLKKLNNLFPFWMFFQPADGKWLKVLAVSLCEGKQLPSRQILYNEEMMEVLIAKWYEKLNELCHKLAITQKINRKISGDVIRIIME